MTTSIPAFSAELHDRYDVGFRPVRKLDNGGEPCPCCQLDGQVIQVQMYATDWDGEGLFLESCEDCTLAALTDASASPLHPVIIEIPA